MNFEQLGMWFLIVATVSVIGILMVGIASRLDRRSGRRGMA